MWRKSDILYLGVLLSFAVYVAGQTGDALCFNFHWLGPDFTKESIFMNSTCARAVGVAKNVPCVHPLVASYDGTWPDVNYIWRHHRNATCHLGVNSVCAKHTYYFNGQPENSTYFCTRAVDQLGNAITSGCHQQINGSYVKKVCFCRSEPGAFPCNNSIIPTMNYMTIALMAIIVLLQNVVNNKYINYNG